MVDLAAHLRWVGWGVGWIEGEGGRGQAGRGGVGVDGSSGGRLEGEEDGGSWSARRGRADGTRWMHTHRSEDGWILVFHSISRGRSRGITPAAARTYLHFFLRPGQVVLLAVVHRSHKCRSWWCLRPPCSALGGAHIMMMMMVGRLLVGRLLVGKYL